MFVFPFLETQHPRDDGGGQRDPASPGDGSALAGREKVPPGRREGRCGVHQKVNGTTLRNIAKQP